MKITLETDHEIFTTEFKGIDANIEDILNAFKGMLVSATFAEETVIQGMRYHLEQYTEEEDEAEIT